MRRVRSRGEIKWAGDLIFVSEALIGEPVAIEETEEGEMRVRYADVALGFIKERPPPPPQIVAAASPWIRGQR